MSHHRAETVVEFLDCQQCGACCFSESERFVRVTGDDYARLGDVAADLTHFIEHRAFMRMVDGHCAALNVNPESRRFTCQVYEQRPDVCRNLANGSLACKGERFTKSEPALVSLRNQRCSNLAVDYQLGERR